VAFSRYSPESTILTTVRSNPEAFAKAIVEATANYDKPEVLAEVSKGLGEAMKGLEMSTLSESDRMQDRGI
jgi:pyridoxal 5'-phosphate synthase pdxS subunit